MFHGPEFDAPHNAKGIHSAPDAIQAGSETASINICFGSGASHIVRTLWNNGGLLEHRQVGHRYLPGVRHFDRDEPLIHLWSCSHHWATSWNKGATLVCFKPGWPGRVKAISIHLCLSCVS